MSFPDERLREVPYAGRRTGGNRHAVNLHLWLGGAALAFGIFVLVTRELLEGATGGIDQRILNYVVSIRSQLLTRVATDMTSLGSNTLVVLFAGFALALLLVFRDRLGAIQLLVSCIGAGVLTFAVKNIIERARPELAVRLVAVSGYSYPSGHSVLTSAFYLTIAIVASHHVRYGPARATIVLGAVAALAMVGASRIYLGVHYTTDVISGLSLGAAWSLLLAGLVARYQKRRLLSS